MTHPVKKHEPSCVFCREQTKSRNTNFARLYPDIDSRTILESDNLIIFPCIGQLTEKHCLIITKNHFNSFSQASNSGLISTDEIQELIISFNNLFVSEDEKLLFFEHGALCQEDGGCGIYHAHIHLVPVKQEIPITSLYNFSCLPLGNLANCLAAMPPQKSYVMAGLLGLNEIYIEECKEPLSSQFLRKQLANLININDWDWRLSKKQLSLVNMLSNCTPII